MYNCNYFLAEFISVNQYGLFVGLVLVIATFLFFKHVWVGKLSVFGYLLILGGGVYNVLVRLSGRCVWDDINTGISYVNLADLLIGTGFIIVILAYVKSTKKEK